MTLSSKSLAGPGYVILNAIRVMNVVAFLSVIAASVVMLVKTSTASKFFFFDAVTHVVTAVTSMFLLISEVALFKPYFARNWPLLGPSHGFVTLAVAMIVIGVNMLGNLNKPATSQELLGLGMWRIVIGSGIVIFILGFFNFFASYVFRDYRQDITARQVRAKGASVHKTAIIGNTTSAPSMRAVSPVTPNKTSFNFFNRTPTDEEVLPSYHSTSPKSNAEAASPSSKYSRATCDTGNTGSRLFFDGRKRESVGPSLPINISAPMGVNPQFAHLVQPQGVQVQRPDSAMHPSRTVEGETQRFKS